MTEIGTFTPEQARMLWQDYQQRKGLPVSGQTSRGSRPLPYQPPIAVVLDATLAVAVNSKTGATSALATRCIWSSEQNEYSELQIQITVWNHSESDHYDAGTFGFASWIDGHWWFIGDCAPMAAR